MSRGQSWGSEGQRDLSCDLKGVTSQLALSLFLHDKWVRIPPYRVKVGRGWVVK